MDERYLDRGFLPSPDPLVSFPHDSELAQLDELGRDLPSLLEDASFRKYAKSLEIPAWTKNEITPEDLPALRLYYVRLGFLASGYVNQLGQEPASMLPANIAEPLCHAAKLLNRPPILSYDGYALYNWKRFNPEGPIALGNIDTLQNFVHMYDEHWFILVHIEIEAIAGQVLNAIHTLSQLPNESLDTDVVDEQLIKIHRSVLEQVRVLRRIPEKMDASRYYKTFRPYIRFFENVVYEGINQGPMQYRGETGAQSSIMPILDAFLKIPHEKTVLTEHLMDMRNYMPAEDRGLIANILAMPNIRDYASAEPFNNLLEAIAEFRDVHFTWAKEYIQKWVKDPRGTGGTPYMKWLKKLIDETLDYRK